MRNFDENSITGAVLARLRQSQDARLREVSEALVTHLHDFVRAVRPTQQEWEQAIDFLTRTGQKCTAERQEFILLSDVLGVSMLVDAINNADASGSTETTVLGPFYVQGPPVFPFGADIGGGMQGEPLHFSGSVCDGAGQPLGGAIVDVWHADGDGYYDVQQDPSHLTGRARFVTGADGRFAFWTVKPSSYPIPTDGPVGELLKAQGRHPYRPAHVHFMIAKDGYRTLVTHIFVAGDRYLDSDAVFGVKDSIIADFKDNPPGPAPDGSVRTGPFSTASFDFRLAT